jgi:hypothetical protein
VRTEEEQLGNESVNLAAPLGRGSTRRSTGSGLRQEVDERANVGLAQFATLPRVETIQPVVSGGLPIPRRAAAPSGMIGGTQQTPHTRGEVL